MRHRPIPDDDRQVLRIQPHTDKDIFDLLKNEYGSTGRYTVIKDYVREHRHRNKEMFVPLSRPLGHTRRDFGRALVVVAGEQKAHC